MAEPAGFADRRIAQVVPLLRLPSLGDRHFDYVVPGEMAGRVAVGSVVRVPFGKRQARGVVVGTGWNASADAALDLKSIESAEERTVSPELMLLAENVAQRYMATLESCLRLVVPPAPSSVGSGSSRRTDDWVFRSRPGDGCDSTDTSLTTKQAVLLALIPVDGLPYKVALDQAGVGKSVMAGLAQKGLVRVAAAPHGTSDGGSLDSGRQIGSWPTLAAEQERAVELLAPELEGTEVSSRQLWGVTGSGKTEVYLHLTKSALSRGYGVILLVPEIALTPLMIGRVRDRFGDLVGVIHSGLTPSQRRQEYARIADGEARVVVGARSAVFSPVRDLRLVIIDESHDNSYKQEETPGYLTRSVAQMRLEGDGGLLVEGSASPAVEAISDPSSYVRMRERVKGVLPVCEVVDMRHRSGGGVLAGVTREALAETIRRGEQAIVLLNRRGYSGHVYCEACGHVMMCGECELSLTYHSRTKRLVCHHCGRTFAQPAICPECNEAPLVRGGPGTERLAEEISHLARAEHVYRLDSDVITSGTRAQRILHEFSSSRPGVLVGTQMVAKGHDFPEVTLVVVADADMGLYVPDFRAAERTYQLLTQVSGRAGRADRPGRVLVQTWNPDVPCIRMALDREDEAYYLREEAIRERLGYPPFTELVRLVMVGEQPLVVQKAAQHLAGLLRQHFDDHEVRGPARLASLRGKSRWHVVVSSEKGDRARAIVGQAIAQLKGPYRGRGVGLLVDVDPYTFV